jgi:class 3 adenylate cyclase
VTLSPVPHGTVSLFFTDIERSTELARRVGEDHFAVLLATHHQLIRAALAGHGGREIDTAGDGFFAAFQSARDAVAAAVDAQKALSSFAWPPAGEIRVRMGIHTAEPHVSATGYSGVAVHRAARICDAGRGGQVLVSSATAGIIEDDGTSGWSVVDLGEHHLKGLSGGQRLFQLVADGLTSEFGPVRTADAASEKPGTGTFLHTDLTGWRRVILKLGDAASQSLTNDYQSVVAAAAEANHGAVLERAGDHVVAVFRDASDAVETADSIKQSLRDFPWPEDVSVSLAVVIHSGRWSGNPRKPEAGTALYRLARFAKIAEPGQVVVTYSAAALLEGDLRYSRLRDLGEVDVPDFDAPVHAYELLDPS